MLSQARIRTLGLTLLIGLHIGLSGCASWFGGDFRDPEVRLLKVEVIKAKLLEQRFSLRFRIDNPNDSDLPIRGLVYDIHINGIQLAKGESSESFNVPARGRSEFEIPVRTNLWRHVKDIVQALEQPNQPIPYRLSGEVKTGMLFGRSVHLQRNGEIIPGDYLQE